MIMGTIQQLLTEVASHMLCQMALILEFMSTIGWMMGDLRFYVLISVISGQWAGDNERL